MQDAEASVHRPVLLSEIVQSLVVAPGGVYVDGTVGGGGYAAGLIRAGGAGVRVIGIDRDATALVRAHQRLRVYRGQYELVRGNFSEMSAIVERQGCERVDGIVLDLGVSSDQLDAAERGFSYLKDGPLDMRMDSSQACTAAEIVNTWPEEDLVRIFAEYGEEPQASRIARAITRQRERRPIRTTLELAETVRGTTGGRIRSQHPATRVFQAVRIAVNNELASLRAGLESGLTILKEGGRFAVVSFHSLEDRIVKQVFAAHVGRMQSLPEGGEAWQGSNPRARWVTKKPVVAGPEEVCGNPRARSAKLRVAERVSLFGALNEYQTSLNPVTEGTAS